ncbi:MAG: hypothetical protein F6K30_12095 [Cyanothece sp. SIO2G6]|nr:hypothetical protein [Cyanothece sp. SIO2G6]
MSNLYRSGEDLAIASPNPNGTDLRLVGSAHPTVYQHFQRSQFAYVSAIGPNPSSVSRGFALYRSNK